MITFTYSEDEERQAEERATAMVRRGLYNRFNGSEAERIAHAKTGCLGEIMFEKILQNSNVSYAIDRTDFNIRNADEFDFKMKDLKFDVKVAKTTRQPSNRWPFGYPCQQINMQKDFVVIGFVNETNRTGGFYGWIPFSIIQQYPVVGRNTLTGIPYRTPNHEFPWGDLCQNFDEFFNALRTYDNKQECSAELLNIYSRR